MKKNCCWVYYKWVIIQNQVVILEIKLQLFYTTKKELDHAAGIDTYDLAAKNILLL